MNQTMLQGRLAIFRINYKSDFIITLNSDAGWMTPFCIKFWTGAPSQAYFAGFDGTTYTNCAPVAGEPTKLQVQFDDHNLPTGELKYQIGYHFTVADFPTTVEDEVLNQERVVINHDGQDEKVLLDFNGETAPDIQFSLPAYANEAQRIANEEQRIANEAIRIVNEEVRIAAEQTRQQNEAQRIAQETARVQEFARLKRESESATSDATAAATLANTKAQLAADKAALAQSAADLANAKALLAEYKAALAASAAQLANDKAALAQQKAEYAQTQGTYAKNQGDYAKQQGDYAKDQGDTALADHLRAEADHGTAASDHTRAESDHSTASSDHTQASTDHSTATSDHSTAAADHTQAGTDHTRAESDHSTAASDHTTAGNDHTRAESDHTRAESDHAAVEVYVDSLGAYDISAAHAVGGVLATYANLQAALGTNGANIPEGIRKGGMSVKFIQGSVHRSDNNYVQFRYMGTSTATADFTNVANWQEVEERVIPLTSISYTVEDSGVTKAGDMYFNAYTKTLRMCTVYNTSPSDSIYVNVEKDVNKVYKVRDKLYVFNKVTSSANIQEIAPNRYVLSSNQDFVVELYLTGLDASKTYILQNAVKTSIYEYGGIVDSEDTSTLLAYFEDTTFSKGIVAVREYNNSGISGYIIKNFDRENIISNPIINNDVVSSLDESPSIKTYLIKEDIEWGTIVAGKSTNATNDSKGNFLIGETFGNGTIKEIYINKDVVGQYLTDEQLESVNKITVVLNESGYYGIRLYSDSTLLYTTEIYPSSEEIQRINEKGFFYYCGIAVVFDPYISVPTGVVPLSTGIKNNFYDLSYNKIASLNLAGINSLSPVLTDGYRKLDGTIQSTQNFGYTQPIYIHAGETVNIYTTSSTAVSVISLVDRNNTFKKVLAAGTTTSRFIYRYTANNDCFVSVCVKKASGSLSEISVIKADEDVTVLSPDMNWLDHQYINDAGLWIPYASGFCISHPIEVYKGDVLSLTAIGSTLSSLLAKSRKDGSGQYSKMGYDTQLEPLIVASDNTERTYTYTIDEHCYVVVTAAMTQKPQLYIHRKEKRNIQIQTIDDWNKTKYAEQKHFYVDDKCFVPNLAKKRSNAILTYEGDDKKSSNYIANAVVYFNGEILACRKGGAVVKIMNDGTEVPIQYNGADMVITGASDWRGVFMDSNQNVFISPHSSMGRGSDNGIAINTRGIYKIPYGTNTATKVLSLYNGSDVAPTRVNTWAESTSYSVGNVVFYLTRCYKCTQSHTSTSEFDSSKFSYLNQWTANTSYAVGDMVRNGNHDYECITAHTSGSAFDSNEQNNWVAATTCMDNSQDTIWTFCEDDKGGLYAGVYAHVLRKAPIIYKSADGGIHWRYIYNFATDSDIQVQSSWLITQGPRHIHGITFNEYDNCLYCACGEVNSIFKSSDYGFTWENLKCAGYHGKPTSVIGVPDGIIIGSDGQWECGLTKICTDGKTAKLVGEIWASFIFYIRRSDLTGWIYAFSRLDNVIANKGDGQPCPPVDAMTDPAELQAWKESVTNNQLAYWQKHHDFCEKYYPDDAIIPHHAAIMVSKDNGDTWEMIRYEDVGTNGSSGFFTIGYFRNGECLCGLIKDDGNGNIYTKPIIISEGKKKQTDDGYDLSGEIFIKLNTSNIVDY